MTSADFYPQPGEGRKEKEKNKKRNRKRNKNKNKSCDYSYNKCSKRKFFAGFVMLLPLLLGPSSSSLCVCWESMLNNNDSRDNSDDSERAGIVSGSWENNQLFLLSLSTNICATCAAGNRVCNICLPGTGLPSPLSPLSLSLSTSLAAPPTLWQQNCSTLLPLLRWIVVLDAAAGLHQPKWNKDSERGRERNGEKGERDGSKGEGCGNGGIFNQLAYHAHLGRPLSLHLNLCLCKSKLLPMAHFTCLSSPHPPPHLSSTHSPVLC